MENNLPVNYKNRNMPIKISDSCKRVGKIALNFGGAIAGVTISAVTTTLSVPAIPIITLAGGIYSAVKGGSNIIYKSEPSLMFVTRKQLDGSIAISQDSLKIPAYLRNISNIDKASIMGLQTLVGLQRYKTKLKLTKEPLLDSEGKKVYPQKFSTVTHSININNLKALEKAGYIEIVGEESEFKHSIFSRKNKPLRSLLIFEKIGFSNTQGLRQIFEATKNGDKKGLDDLRKDFKKITFRLTDKDIDFEDIYKKINGYTEYESDEEKANLKRLRTIFKSSNSRIPGILSTKKIISQNGKNICINRERKIDIKYDKYGRPIIDYDARESFGEKIERNFQRDKTSQENKFEADLKKGVDLSKFSEPTIQETSNLSKSEEIEK